ncbi:hypothetical protein C8R43DRAFT_1244816 [Mycena crocata]|nr:hypothetical protein C8R43DRAFT_1244816 [Mycena crocata]
MAPPAPPRFAKDHPLHPDHIQKLPITFKGMVKRAMNHSVNDSWTLCNSVRGLQAKFPKSTVICILPALYANLDPARIPNTDMDDGNLITDAVECAITATHALCLLQNPHPSIPVAAILDIWPRYWAITTAKQRSHVRITGMSEFELGSNVVLFMASFDDKRVCNLFGATPGVRVLLARNWFLLVQPEGSGARGIDIGLDKVFKGLDQVFKSVSEPGLNASQSAGLEEYAEGAGGTVRDLASLIVESITVLVPNGKPSIAGQSLKFIWAIVTFVNVAAIDDTDDPMTSFRVALWETGFVESLTKVMHNVAENKDTMAKETVVTCSWLLGTAFAYPGLVEEALRAGLLPALLRCVLLPKDRIEDIVNGILQNLLNYGVVRRIEGALPDTEAMIGSPLAKSQTWVDFIGLARKRISISKALSDCIACDNMTCAVMSPDKTIFKRCICNNHYCSKACQKADWRAGHRTVCRSLIATLHRRESVFIRAIVHNDYELLKADTIYPEQVRFMAQFPNDVFFTLFDYTDTRRLVPRCKVDSVEKLESEMREAWFDLLLGTRDGEGPMELHVVKDDLGDLMVPLRTNSSAVHDGMRSIAASLPPAITAQIDSPALLAAVRAVLDGEKDHFRTVH